MIPLENIKPKGGKMTYKNLVKNYGYHMYFVFRVLIGLLFLQRGLQKLFGAFGGLGGDGTGVALFSLMGLAGIIEFLAGIAITLGFFTRLAASIAAIELIVAYFRAHLPAGFIPLLNGGEPAVLFIASFIALTVYGARKWSLEKALLKKEIF